jgi:hypothetical protein
MTETETFEWRDQELPLLDHPYNTTALNERAWEVPLAQHWINNRMRGGRTMGRGLEVGNVLSHYPPHNPWAERRIVDLWEVADGVDNVDVREIEGEYDWILSISTLEHVGGDGALGRYAPTDAMLRLQGLLAPGGSMLVTIPFGQQPYLDVAILEHQLGPLSGGNGTSFGTMVRSYNDGLWRWAEGELVWTPSRGNGWPSSVWVAEWKKP